MWKKLSPFKRFLIILISIPLGLLLIFKLFTNDKYLQIKRNEEVKNLEIVIPLLRKNKVTVYRFQEKCKVLEYNDVSYAYVDPEWTSKETCTYPLNNEPVEFDEKANNPLVEIKEALKETGIDIYLIDHISYTEGQISKANFNKSGFGRYRYMYESGRAITQYTTDNSNFWNYPINKDWYFQIEDWN